MLAEVEGGEVHSLSSIYRSQTPCYTQYCTFPLRHPVNESTVPRKIRKDSWEK